MSDELKACPLCASADVHFGNPGGEEESSYDFVVCNDCGISIDRATCGIDPREAWNRRTAPISAPLDTQALPPLTNDHIIEIADKTRTAESRDGDYILPISFARAIEAEIIAPYAARIAHLERELKQAKLQHLADIGQDIERELAERKPVSIGEDRKFHRLLVDFGSARFQDVQTTRDRVIAYIDGRTAGAAPLDPVEGDLLPPIGAKVLIHLGRQDAWVEHTVAGYYVWGALSHQVRDGEKHAHRVFVRVKDANGYDNARLLSEVRPVAAAPSPQSKQEEANEN